MFAAGVVHGAGDREEVLEELGRDIFVSRIRPRELERHAEEIEAKHPHPARAIALLEITAARQRRAAIEDADVVEAEKSALENVAAGRVLAIHPPGEVDQQLVEDRFQKRAIGRALLALFHFVNTPRRPGEHRRVDVAEVPLVGGHLAVRVLVPFAEREIDLLLREVESTSASGMQWNARSHEAYQGYSHLSGIDMTRSL